MWIVALALRRPYTFVVMAIVILILTPITILRTPTDIFPDINIPVVSVVWFYSGMSPQDMADRIVANSERGIRSFPTTFTIPITPRLTKKTLVSAKYSASVGLPI